MKTTQSSGTCPLHPNGSREDPVRKRRPVHPNRVHRPAAQPARWHRDFLVVSARERVARTGHALPAAPRAHVEQCAQSTHESARLRPRPALRREETHPHCLLAPRSDDARLARDQARAQPGNVHPIFPGFHQRGQEPGVFPPALRVGAATAARQTRGLRLGSGLDRLLHEDGHQEGVEVGYTRVGPKALPAPPARES